MDGTRERGVGAPGAGFVAHARLTGPDFVVESVNLGWQALFPGVSRRAPLAELVGDQMPSDGLERLRKVLTEGVPLYGDQQVVSAPGRGDVLLDIQLEPHRDSEGTVVGVDVFAIDITTQTRSTTLLQEQRSLLEQVAASGSLHEVLHRMVRLIEQNSVDGVIASVLLIDADGRLELGAAPSLPDFYNEAIDGLAIGPKVGSCGTAAYRRESVIVTNIETDPLWEDFRPLAREAGVSACWSSPILTGDGEVLGTFAMYYRTPHEPTDHDLEASIMFARTAALAIERHRADEARAKAQADLQYLLDASTEIAASDGYVESARRLTRLVVPRLSDVCVLDVVEDGVIRRLAAAVAGPDGDQAATRLVSFAPRIGSEHPVARAVAAFAAGGVTEVLRGPDIKPYAVNEDHRRVHLEAGVSEYACVPLVARGEAFGVLTLMATADRPLSDATITLAEDLASRVALVLDTIRQVDQRVRLVTELQQGLLPPRLPAIPGVELAVSYAPGSEGLEVGGDFYDVFALPDGRWALLIGDVSGRGASAASITALARHTIRALAPLLTSPTDVISAANDALLAVEDAERFITAAYAVLTPAADGSVRVALVSAGHPAPLIRRADGSVSVTAAEGPLLGQLPGVRCEVDDLVLYPGDLLVMVTDGVLEARTTDGSMFGEEGLRAVLAARTTPDTAGVVADIDTAVLAFSGTPIHDDRAVVALAVSS